MAAGIPADLLRRRPDIREAERNAAAQSAQIGVAEADFYPRLAINGFVGYASNDLNDLFTPKHFTGFIFPNISWNVLNYGRIRNNVLIQDARYDRAVLEYQSTVLRAGREVEDALIGFVTAQQQAAQLQISVYEAQRSLEIVNIQYQGGVTDFNRVFTLQEQLVGQQDQLAAALGNIAVNWIAVYRALGGGWQLDQDGARASGECSCRPGCRHHSASSRRQAAPAARATAGRRR